MHGAIDWSFRLVWQCHQLLSEFLDKGHLPRVSRQSRRSLMIRMIMKWSWGLCTDLLVFALQLTKTFWWRGCGNNQHLKWGSSPPNEVGRIAQHIWMGWGLSKLHPRICILWRCLHKYAEENIITINSRTKLNNKRKQWNYKKTKKTKYFSANNGKCLFSWV